MYVIVFQAAKMKVENVSAKASESNEVVINLFVMQRETSKLSKQVSAVLFMHKKI